MTEPAAQNNPSEAALAGVPDAQIPDVDIPEPDIADVEIPAAPGEDPGVGDSGLPAGLFGESTRPGDIPEPVVPEVQGPPLGTTDPQLRTGDPAKGTTEPVLNVGDPVLAEPVLNEPVLGGAGVDGPALSLHHINDRDTIRRLLTTPARWAIVGLSNNPLRAAIGVARIIRDELGMDIVPVSLKGDTVHGERGYTRLDQIPGTIDVVDCFVNSTKVGAIVDQAIDIGAKAVWLQVGVIDEEAAARAKAAGLDVVMDACPAIERRNVILE